LDLHLGQESGLTLLPKLKAINHEQRIVVLTGIASIPTAVEAIKLGAFNYRHEFATVKELLAAFEDSNDQTEIDINDVSMLIERLEWAHIQRIT
jgi:two-component system response regulator RegA